MKKIFSIALITTLLCSYQPNKITWVALGDSITYLNDHPAETGNRVTKGFLTRVTEQWPGMSYINQGHNGWTAVRIAKEIRTLGIVPADVYTVFLGTNDWWHGERLGRLEDYTQGTGDSTVYGSFRIIVNHLRGLNPRAKIIFITPMQRVDFVSVNNFRNNAFGSYREKDGQALAQFAGAVKNIGRYEHFEVVDLYNKSGMNLKNLVRFKRLRDPATAGAYRNYSYPDFIDVPFHPESDEYPYPVDAIGMTYDGLHPSDKGNAIIASMVVKAMKKAGVAR